MAEKAVFYHAGCTVCVDAEQRFAGALNPAAYEVEVVHLGETPQRLDEAEAAGVKSVPAIVRLSHQPWRGPFRPALMLFYPASVPRSRIAWRVGDPSSLADPPLFLV